VNRWVLSFSLNESTEWTNRIAGGRLFWHRGGTIAEVCPRPLYTEISPFKLSEPKPGHRGMSPSAAIMQILRSGSM